MNNSSQDANNSSDKLTPDQCAAHEFLSELRTRIATQTLPYQYGVEARALESLWELFAHAREAMKKHPGCAKFADAATRMLNEDLRPVTAKWHRAHEDGRLNSKDGANKFRDDLAQLQMKLRDFASELHKMAYGTEYEDEEAPPVLTEVEMNELSADLPFGIPEDSSTIKFVADINKSEADEIITRRGNYKLNTPERKYAVGLAYSGGGIRSATFSLGVTQVLANNDLLKDVDFLSTVSGGGYTGSFITRRLGKEDPPPELGQPHGPDPEPIQYLRHHAEFLIPNSIKDGWSIITSIFAGMILNWSVPFLVIAVAALAAAYIRPWVDDRTLTLSMACLAGLTCLSLWPFCYMIRKGKRLASLGGWILGVPSALTVLLFVAWLIRLGYAFLPKWLATLGTISGGVGALLAAGPAIIRFMPIIKTPSVRKIALKVLLVAAGAIVPIIAVIIFYGCYYVAQMRPQSATQIDAALLPPIFISYAKEDLAAANSLKTALKNTGCTVWLGMRPDDVAPGTQLPVELENKISHECSAFISVISTATESAADGWAAAERNIAALRARKMADPGRFYFPVVIDSRLAPRIQGFSKEPNPVRQLPAVYCPGGIPPKYFSMQLADLQSPRPKLERILIRNFGKSKDGRDILLVVAGVLAFVTIVLLNINLTAPHRIYRSRLAKTFIETATDSNVTIPLSDINSSGNAPYHLINCALNLPSSSNSFLRDRKCDFFLFSKHWCGSPVVDYRKTEQWRTDGSEIDLATTMAISGAAASSYMGLQSMPALSALMTFFNVRLGFWIRHPKSKLSFPKAPGFACLMREMTGIGMSENRPWLNISDGGHIENMAVYELLRRRCKYIICVDGEDDGGFKFGGFLTLVRHAQIDFGIRIESRLKELRPDPQTGCSATHAVLCRVYYPAVKGQPKAKGLLLYMKLSVTGNESELIKRYRMNNPAFPHQTTLDQFFDQEQFEAYRQLGVHVAEGLFSSALMGHDKGPETVKEWFLRLAKNLLEPEGSTLEDIGRLT